MRRGQTALHQAAESCRRSVCCMLVAAGSNLTMRDHHGNTATDLARRADDEQLAQYLQSKLDVREKRREEKRSKGLFNSTAELKFCSDNPTMLDHSSSSSTSEDKEIYSKADKAELASLAIRTAYQEMSKQFSNYTIDSCSSAESSSPDEKISYVKPLCSCSHSSPYPINRGLTTPVTDPYSPSRLCSQITSVMVHSESDSSVAPIQSPRNTNLLRESFGSESSIANYECLECQAKFPFDRDSDKIYSHNEIFSTLDEFEETVFDRDCYAYDSERNFRKPSVDNSEVFEMPSFSRSSLIKEPPVVPVHSKPLKSIIKRVSKKTDSMRSSKTVSTASRISQSLRSTHSIRSNKSLINSRGIGGSLRHSLGATQPIASLRAIPSITCRIPTAPPCASPSAGSPARNPALIAAGHASSVVLALAATHASTLALSYNPIKLPFLTPAAAAQAQLFTQALADVLLEEGRNVSRPLSQSLKEERQRGILKRIKLERLI